MKRTLIQATLILLATTLSISPAMAGKKSADVGGDAIATVNGKSIPKSRADTLIASAGAQGRQDSDALRKQVREELITRELLAQEGVKKGYDKHSEVLLAQQQVVISAYLNDYVKAHPIGDDAVKKQYEAFRAVAGDKEYKARHILVETEDQAKDIVARLKKGEKFDDLAKQSKDPGSKDKGGDLDWATPNNYVKPFADALVKLEKGKYTDVPVQSPFGWHVIRLDDTRQFTAPSMDEVKPQILQSLQQQIVKAHIQELREKAKVE
jgi:peptidyl-prolyl cis-trans isomerase C